MACKAMVSIKRVITTVHKTPFRTHSIRGPIDLVRLRAHGEIDLQELQVRSPILKSMEGRPAAIACLVTLLLECQDGIQCLPDLAAWRGPACRLVSTRGLSKRADTSAAETARGFICDYTAVHTLQNIVRR